MSGEWVFFPSFFGTVSFVVWVVVNAWHRRQHVKLITEFNNRVLERLASMRELADFLHSESGERLLKVLTAERGAAGPRERILTAVQAGTVFVTLGAGTLLVGWRSIGDAHEALTLIGTIVLSLGVGLVLSSAASFWVARGLGMFDAE